MSHTVISERFEALIDRYAPVNQLGAGFTFTEGPIWHPLEKHLLFSDMPADVRRRWTPDGRVTEVMRPSNKGNGMTYDAELNLLVCEHATSSVARFRRDGAREVLCSHYEGRELNSPNDVCVRSDGSIYFTDPTYGRMPHFGVPRPTQMGFQGVYMLPPDHRPGAEPVLVSDRRMFTQPNGLCFSPCEQYMWVNDTDQANIRKFDVAADGRLTNGRIFAAGVRDSLLRGVPDGMKSDTEGNVWVTAPGGLWVYSFDGALLGKVSIPEMAANLHWGGEDWDTLFVCAETSLYAVRTKARPRSEPFMRATPGPARRDEAAASGSAPGAAPLRIDPRRTALVIQDMQNDVIIENGAFADSGSPAHARAQKRRRERPPPRRGLPAERRAGDPRVVRLRGGASGDAVERAAVRGREVGQRAGARQLGRGAGAGPRAAVRGPGGGEGDHERVGVEPSRNLSARGGDRHDREHRGVDEHERRAHGADGGGQGVPCAGAGGRLLDDERGLAPGVHRIRDDERGDGDELRCGHRRAAGPVRLARRPNHAVPPPGQGRFSCGDRSPLRRRAPRRTSIFCARGGGGDLGAGRVCGAGGTP